jgi:uncharacterized protein
MTSAPPPFEHPGPPMSRPELPDGAPPPPEPPSGLPPLGVPAWAPFVALLVTFVAVLFAGLVVGTFIGVGGGDLEAEGTETGLTLVLTAVQFVILVTAAWYIAKVFSPPTPASFGLKTTPALPALGWTLLIYVGFWLLAGATLLILGEPEEQQLVRDIQDEDSLAVLAVYAGLSCFIAPVCEELFFRGFMFRALAERIHFVWAAIVSGGVFGISHAAGSPATSLVVLSFFGIALCLLLWRTASLLPCIMLHAFNNSVSFGLAKELPWWGVLLLIVGSVGMTFLVSLLVVRLARGPSPAPS